MTDSLPTNAFKNPAARFIQRIRQAQEANAPQWRRNHLGASVVGNECDRKVWLSFRWATNPRLSGRKLEIFWDGHRLEERVVELMRLAGHNVQVLDPETGEQPSFKHGHYGGSRDGLIVQFEGGADALLEVKSANTTSFRKFQKDGVEKWNPIYFRQVQIYLFEFSLPLCVFVVRSKNDGELGVEFIECQPGIGVQMRLRALRIAGADNPPRKISGDPEFFQCKLCDHQGTCQYGHTPARSCRTCLFVTPNRDGAWTCEKHQTALDYSDQVRGCNNHLFNPGMIGPVKWAEEDEVHYEDGRIDRAGTLL